MADLLKRPRTLAGTLGLTFLTTVGSAAAEGVEFREVVNGRPMEVVCDSVFPGLPENRDPADRIIGLVDTYAYHGGQTGPIGYAVMSPEQRKEHWRSDGVNTRNRPFYEAFAREYDSASDKNEFLQRSLHEAHRPPRFEPFPLSRWDDWADRCER